MAAFAPLGCGRALVIHPPATSTDLAYYNTPISSTGPPIQVVGVVTGEPLLADRSQSLRISAETIRLGGSTSRLVVKGDLQAVLPRYPEYSFGERLVLEGILTGPPTLGDFDYAAWLGRQGIYSYMSFPRTRSLGRSGDEGLEALVSEAREEARNTLRRTVAEPQASVAIGVVVGDHTALPDALSDDFRRTGTLHILAISGQSISLLSGSCGSSGRAAGASASCPYGSP